jgi:hypothetical protein
LRQGGVRIIKKELIPGIIMALSIIIAFPIMLFSFAGCQEQTDPRDTQLNWPPLDTDSQLVGTRWHWGDWGGATLFFETPETVMSNLGDSEEFALAYVYNNTTRSGQVDTLGRFTVTGDYEKLNFSEWRNFGHGVEFTRIE